MSKDIPVNDNLVLICGESKGGKSTSLRNLLNPEGVVFLNCEANRKLTFPAKFRQFPITDPYEVYDAFDWAEKPEQADVHTIVIDTITFLMDMFVSVHVIGSANTMQMWGEYAEFFRNLMQDKVARSTKNVICLAHVKPVFNEELGRIEKVIPVKGALAGNGLEAFFSNIIMACKMPVKDLTDKNSLLTITPREKLVGIKHVFQTMITKQTLGTRIGGPMFMWNEEEGKTETFIDNDVQLVMDRLRQYYS